jgi:hypothetical protein
MATNRKGAIPIAYGTAPFFEREAEVTVWAEVRLFP